MNKLIKFAFISLALTLIVTFWPRKKDNHDYEKTLHVALEAPADNLDPVLCSTSYSSQLLCNVYEGLLEHHYLKRPYECRPNLAAAMPTISDDGLTYTFVIKKGVYFHDNPCFPNGQGRELTAEDFVYSFKRIADPALQSPFFKGLFADKISGMVAFHEHLTKNKGDYSPSIDGIQALDKYTLQFKLTKPFPSFLNYLVMHCAYVVAKEAVAYYSNSFINHPVGTGPFTLASFNPQDNKIIFNKNKKFRDKFFPTEASPNFQHMLDKAGKKLPFLDKIIYHAMYEHQPRWLQFKEKKIDYIRVHETYLPAVFENQELNQELSQQGITLLQEQEPQIRYIGFNCLKKPLDNLKLRQAMSLAFDRAGYNRLFLANLATMPPSWIPSCFEGYNKEFKNPYAVYDVVKAKQYLADAGYPDGQGLPTFTVDCSLNTHKPWIEFFAKCMKQIGIKIEIQQSVFPEFVKKIAQGQYIMSASGWIPDYPDTAAIFEIVRKKALVTGVEIENQMFNQLYDQASHTNDVSKKRMIYEQLNDRATTLAPALLLPKSPEYILTHARLKNFVIYHYNNVTQYLDVEPH